MKRQHYYQVHKNKKPRRNFKKSAVKTKLIKGFQTSYGSDILLIFKNGILAMNGSNTQSHQK